MTSLYIAFNEMQELYNTFERQSNTLQDHNTRKRVAAKAFDNVLDW